MCSPQLSFLSAFLVDVAEPPDGCYASVSSPGGPVHRCHHCSHPRQLQAHYFRSSPSSLPTSADVYSAELGVLRVRRVTSFETCAPGLERVVFVVLAKFALRQAIPSPRLESVYDHHSPPCTKRCLRPSTRRHHALQPRGPRTTHLALGLAAGSSEKLDSQHLPFASPFDPLGHAHRYKTSCRSLASTALAVRVHQQHPFRQQLVHSKSQDLQTFTSHWLFALTISTSAQWSSPRSLALNAAVVLRLSCLQVRRGRRKVVFDGFSKVVGSRCAGAQSTRKRT